MSLTMAWVTDSQKAKVTSDEVLISKTDDLMVSLNDIDFTSVADATTELKFKNVNLKDFSGDGVNLYSAVIDAFTKQAQTTGWQYIRRDADEDFNEDKVKLLNSNNENKTYYSIDIYFRSTKPLDVYLYKDSFIQPASSKMNKLDDGKKYCLYLRRTATYDEDEDMISYMYEDENGVLGYANEDNKVTFESTKLPTVFNRSIYSYDFDDDLDRNVFYNEGNDKKSYQYQYSANYIAGSTRVAFIDESKTEAPLTAFDYDYNEIFKRVGEHGTIENYAKSRLRLLWAPNPEYHMEKSYNPLTDSSTYNLSIVNLEETYFNSSNGKVGKSVTYPNGNKYYYKFQTVDDENTSSFLLYVNGDKYFDFDGNKIVDLTSQAVADYLGLLESIDESKTVTNQSERTGSRTIDGVTVSDNRFYSYNGSIATLSSVPTPLFANILDSSSDNLSKYNTVATLTKKEGTEFYEGKTKAIIWVEGSDPEASIALTAGNAAGLSEGSGTARIAYCLSFIGQEIPNSDEENND